MIVESLISVLLALFAAPPMQAPTGQHKQAPKGRYKVVPVESGGSITGAVHLDGEVPEHKILETPTKDEVCHTRPIPDESLVVSKQKGVRWAVVSITDITEGKAFPKAAPVLDQKGCRFVPHVLVVPEKTEFFVLNSDGVLHNVHTHSLKNAPVNRSMPGNVTKLPLRFKRKETISITCDVHSWMKGWIVVSSNPYYAVTDENGEFHLENVPPGTYQLQVWHETLGRKSAKVEVHAKQPTHVDFKLKSPK